MNRRIACSLILSVGFYAGTTFCMLSRTSQGLGGAASRGATALGTTSRRIPSSLRLGSTASRGLMTTPRESIGSTQAPLGSQSMSTSSRDADFLAMKQLLEQAETRFPSEEQEQSNKGPRLTLKGVISDLMLWVSGALALWAAKEFVDEKERAAFSEKQNLIARKSNQITQLWYKLNSIRNDFYNKQSASIEDREKFSAMLESAENAISEAYTSIERRPDFSIEDVILVLNTAIVQLEGIVNKYQSYSDWAYQKARSAGAGLAGIAARFSPARGPTHTPKGALTAEGHRQKLEERRKREGHVVEDVD